MAFEAAITRANGYGGLVDSAGLPFRDVGDPLAPTSGYDGFDLPHVLQFNANVGSTRIYWRDRWDEALRSAREDALAMETDTGLMGPLQERMLATANLPGHVAVPNDKDPVQKAVRDHLTAALAQMVGPEEQLHKLRMNLLWGVWFGRQGAKPIWRWVRVGGVKTMCMVDWAPMRGDKISTTKDGIPVADVYGGADQKMFPDSEITYTTNGARGLVLHGDCAWGWRQRVIIHRHELIDGDFFDAAAAEAAMGLGVRSRVYWLDWIRREWLARVCDFIDRVGLGITIWYYDAGNPKAKEQAETASREQSNRTNIVVARYGGEKDERKAVERVEVPVNGAEFLLRMMQDVREQQRLYIIGQTMSTGGDHVGGDMGGSHRAKFAQDTKRQIIEFDSRNLDATLTGSMKNPGLLSMMQYWTFPVTWPSDANPDGFRARWVTDLEDEESKDRLDAATALWGMGVDIKEDELRAAAGFTKPAEGDAVVSGAQGQDVGAPGEQRFPGDGKGPMPGEGGADAGLAPGEDDTSDEALLGDPAAFFRDGWPELYAERREGEVWQGPSGGYFTLKGGHVVPAAAPGGEGGKTSAGAAAPQRVSPAKVAAGIGSKLARGQGASAVADWEAVPKAQRVAVANALAPDQKRDLLEAAKKQKGQSAAPQATAPQAAPAAPADLPTFAKDVADVAAQTKTGGFGENKVFISHVFREMQKKQPGLTAEEFKGRLLEAQQAGLIQLSRADLVGAMNAADVAESSARRGEGEFHFVQSPGQREQTKPDAAAEQRVKEQAVADWRASQAPAQHALSAEEEALLGGDPLQHARDASGHEHKGEGEGGGQFTGSGGGAKATKGAKPSPARGIAGQLASGDMAGAAAAWEALPLGERPGVAASLPRAAAKKLLNAINSQQQAPQQSPQPAPAQQPAPSPRRMTHDELKQSVVGSLGRESVIDVAELQKALPNNSPEEINDALLALAAEDRKSPPTDRPAVRLVGVGDRSSFTSEELKSLPKGMGEEYGWVRLEAPQGTAGEIHPAERRRATGSDQFPAVAPVRPTVSAPEQHARLSPEEEAELYAECRREIDRVFPKGE